ncbi:MAG: hypothetical protein J5710_03340 [Treponema sp.]|nr:hypothetical protein [Treponema sp.]
MSKSKLFSIVTIACFVSILCIPLGIVLMLYYTEWKKKTKIILSLVLTAFYAGLIAFIFIIKPAYNTSGLSLPFGSNSGYTAFDSGSGAKGSGTKKQSAGTKNKASNKQTSNQTERVPKSVQQSQGKISGKIIYPILFFGFMLMLIIIQNLRNKDKSKYENPYVDTNKYKLPFTPDTKMPMVHFLKLALNEGEKIYFATETNQKENEGNLAITNQRVAIFSIKENVEIPVECIVSVTATTSTVMTIGTKFEDQEKKYYVFMPENQMKFAIAVLKWTAKILENKNE